MKKHTSFFTVFITGIFGIAFGGCSKSDVGVTGTKQQSVTYTEVARLGRPLLAKNSKTIQAFAQLGQTLGINTAPSTPTVMSAFFPDEMRVDVRTNAPPGTAAYNASTSGSLGILTGGRKPEDDVVDITLSYLIAGDLSGQTIQDHVQYEGVPGNPGQPGHKLLNLQNNRLGPAQFPFLAGPN